MADHYQINRVFVKTYTNNYAKFQSDRCNLFRVTARQKIDNLHTHTQTHTHTDTHTYIFGRRLFFQCRSYVNKGNGEIWKSIFDTDSRLHSIKDWESKTVKKISSKSGHCKKLCYLTLKLIPNYYFNYLSISESL